MKTTKNRSRDSRCLGWDSNRAPPAYKPRALDGETWKLIDIIPDRVHSVTFLLRCIYFHYRKQKKKEAMYISCCHYVLWEIAELVTVLCPQGPLHHFPLLKRYSMSRFGCWSRLLVIGNPLPLGRVSYASRHSISHFRTEVFINKSERVSIWTSFGRVSLDIFMYLLCSFSWNTTLPYPTTFLILIKPSGYYMYHMF
jgi:hypothetical protein